MATTIYASGNQNSNMDFSDEVMKKGKKEKMVTVKDFKCQSGETLANCHKRYKKVKKMKMEK